MTRRINVLPDIKNSIRMTMLPNIETSRRINDILRITITSNRTLGLLSRCPLAERRTTISVSRSSNCLLSTHILTSFSIGPHLQQQNACTSRRMQPMPDRPSDQNYQQHNVSQSANYNSQTQFSQDQPDYRRGENPRNSHGTRLRPVSELRKSTVIS
jgi:hypothetical protein